MNKTNAQVANNSLIGFSQTSLAIFITALFASGLYVIQDILDTSKLVQSSTPLKAVLWFFALMLGSFCYDTFKTILKMPIETYNKFSINVKGFFISIGLYLLTGMLTLIFLDVNNSTGLGLLIASLLCASLFCLYRTIHYFDEAINDALSI
jgi:hypothetical protein